jgi:hypothetical protein
MKSVDTRSSVRPLTYALAAGLGLVLDLSGALHIYWLGTLNQLLAAATALLLVGIAAGWLLVARRTPAVCADGPAQPTRAATPATHDSARITQRLLTLLMLLAWLATARDLIVFLAPALTPLWMILAAAGALLFALALVRPPAVGWLLLGAALLGSVARLGSVAYVPIEPARGDMLPLVQQALGNLLAGHSPYTRYFMPWELPLTYLPVTWLAYLPPYVLGLDIRVTNLLAELLIGAALAWLAAARHKQRDEPGRLLWAWVFLQPTSLNWSLSTTAPVLWALLALTLVLTLGGRLRRAAFALGLCAAASPLAIVVAPFVLLRWVRVVGWRRAALLACGAGLVALVFVLPFLLWSPQEFVFGGLRWFNDNELFPRLRWDMDQTWARMVGFSGVFWRHGLVGILKPIQALLLAGLIGLYWRWGAAGARLAPLVVAAFLLFMVFNPVLWPYLYNPALLAALVAAIAINAER